MSNTTQMTPYTKVKQSTDHDSRNFGPLVHGYEAQTSTISQTTVNLTQFVCDLSNKSQIMVYVDGQLLTEGVGNDYVWVTGLNNTSSQLTLASAIPAGLNIQLYKIGAPRVVLPTADSINATINLVQAGVDGNSPQYLANGAFDFWQEGISFPAITNATYFADQWVYFKVGTMVHTISRTTPLSTSKSNFSALIDCTTADTSIATTDCSGIYTPIEGNVLRNFRGKNMVLAFTVQSTKTGIFCVSFKNASNNRSLIKEYTITQSNVPTRVYIRFNHDESGTWSYDQSRGVAITWTLASGTAFQTTPNTWQNGDFLATANQVNACDSTANDFILSDAVLMEDNASLNKTPEQYKYFNGSYSAEYSFIQRYFEVIGQGGTSSDVAFAGRNTGATQNRSMWKFNVPKRVVNGTVTYSGSFTGTVIASTTSSAVTAITGSPGNEDCVVLLSTVSGAPIGVAGNLVLSGSGTKLTYSARM